MHDGEKKMAGVVVCLLHEHTGINLRSQPHGFSRGLLLGQQTLRPYPHDARQNGYVVLPFMLGVAVWPSGIGTKCASTGSHNLVRALMASLSAR